MLIELKWFRPRFSSFFLFSHDLWWPDATSIHKTSIHHTFSAVGAESGRVGVGSWTNWRLGSASVRSFWPACASRRASGIGSAGSNLWGRREISLWSSKSFLLRPRSSSAADTCAADGTCPQLPAPCSSPFQLPDYNTKMKWNHQVASRCFGTEQ